MRKMMQAVGTIMALVLCAGSAGAQAPTPPGAEEFGRNPKQIAQDIETVEALISKCMREQGFQYVAVDYNTVRQGMSADKRLPGLSEEQFIDKYGFGISTLYTGQPVQLATGYSPGTIGLGERNVHLYKTLAPADQVAYNHALLGEHTSETFAVALEKENFARTGGCTRQAIEQVFPADQLQATYYSPRDALVNKDPRMKAALRKYAAEMRKAGFDYNHPDDIEPDIRNRLEALTSGGTILLENLLPAQRAALKELQTYERRVAAKSFKLAEKIFDPVEEAILRELYGGKVN